MTPTRAIIREKIIAAGYRPGTHPENLATYRLSRWGHSFVQQHRIGRYRADFAFLDIKVVLEIDGPHHQRPDVAVRDTFRDADIRAAGWIVIRVDTGPTFEAQLARVSTVLHAYRAAVPETHQ